MTLSNKITIVTGLPRSGTSVMMQMLHVGGMAVLHDGLRGADINNPKGYFEYEAVKSLPRDSRWLYSAGGKAVKIIYKLLTYLPADLECNIIFMRRDLTEVAISQDRMLQNRGRHELIRNRQETELLLQQELADVDNFLASRANCRQLDVFYKDVIDSPSDVCYSISGFLGCSLGVDKMVAVVDKSLYRCRQNDK